MKKIFVVCAVLAAFSCLVFAANSKPVPPVTSTAASTMTPQVSKLNRLALEKASFELGNNTRAVPRSGSGNLDDCITPFPEGFETVTTPAAPDCWLILDVNADDFSWFTGSSTSYSHTGTNFVAYQYNSASAADDWLFSAGVALTGGTSYTLKFWQKTLGGATYPETWEIMWGATQDVAGMVNVLQSSILLTNTSYVQLIYSFTPTSTGTYYIGWHCISDPDEYVLLMDDIELAETPTAPGRCCYGNPCLPTCEMKTEVECLALGGAWDGTLTCAATCPVPQPGELCCNALPLIVPGTTLGNNCGFLDNYNAVCPYGATGGRDVVYAFTPATAMNVTFSLCLSGYDTKIYIYDGSCTGTVIACNDDAAPCPGATGDWRSLLPCVSLAAGHSYYVVVDAYNGDECGDYVLDTYVCECELTCPPEGIAEGEPVCADEYVDLYNGGCNSTPAVFQPIACGQTICGTSGTYLVGGVTNRDTDWFQFVLLTPQTVTFTVQAEFSVSAYILGGTCASLLNHGGAAALPCSSATITANLIPGSYMLFVAPQQNTSVPCGADYIATLTCQGWTPPSGRCCYSPDECAVNFEYQCNDLSGTWTADLTCGDPCPIAYNCTCTEPADGRYCNLIGGAIPDGGPAIGFPIVVPVQYHITDLNVCLDILHTYDSDLVIWLESPLGTLCNLIVAQGSWGVNFHCTALDDEAAVAIGDGSAPFEGSFIPDAALSIFDGENAMGTWTLWIEDLYPPDAGILNWACLTFQWDVILAVELASFTATAGNGSVDLLWRTASEENAAYFDVLRDGENITRLNAANDATGANYRFTDTELTNGVTYTYNLVAVDLTGTRETVGTMEATPSFSAGTATEYALYQNYPNPFNPSTTIAFDLLDNGVVSLTVFNLMGQQVATVVNGMMTAGRHTLTWDAGNLPSGIYLGRLEVNGFAAEKKMLLMK